MPSYSDHLEAGLGLEHLYFTMAFGASGAVGTVYSGKSGRIASIAKSTTGTYTITLEKPYPIKVIGCQAGISDADGDDVAGLRCKYKTGSYSASAGTLVLFTTTVVDTTGPVLADPASGAELFVHLTFQRVSALNG